MTLSDAGHALPTLFFRITILQYLVISGMFSEPGIWSILVKSEFAVYFLSNPPSKKPVRVVSHLRRSPTAHNRDNATFYTLGGDGR